MPQGYQRYNHRGHDYYFADGYWYQRQGPAFGIATAPPGLRVRVLPPYAERIWVGGLSYYLAAGTYYLWRTTEAQYEVVPSPYDSPAADEGELMAYPMQGQDQARQDFDRYQCHRWAVEQSGYDPTLSRGSLGDEASRYRRAMAACLSGRGYSVR